jgi:hypothetical protein
MSFRAINQKYLEPGSQVLMVLGIIALCQPWNLFLHTYGVTITLLGLIAFNITSKVPREVDAETDPTSGSGAQH